MKICLPAEGSSENALVSSSFGRCPYYAFYDTETDKFEIVPNPAANAMSGAGIQAAQFIVNKGANVVLTVNMGPNSGEVLTAAGVKIITGVTGTLREAVERYKRGDFSAKENEKVIFSEPKHLHPHHESEHRGFSGINVEREIADLKDEIKALSERTKKLLERLEKLEK